MISLPIALATAGAAALINAWLSMRISRVRTREKISIGDGGNAALAARMRAQLNFAEYTPVVLILIALIELRQGSPFWLWLVAALFILGRALHPLGMDGMRYWRQIATLTAMLSTVGLGLYALVLLYLH